jgi:hypothetical protein
MRSAFKEWAVVVDALGRGEQTLILRKGGIAEASGGFRVEHPDFFLFPTLFHQQRECVVPEGQTRFDLLMQDCPPMDQVRLQYFASAAGWWRLGSLDTVRQLKGLHIWRDEVVEERFKQGAEQALYVLALRIFRLPKPVELPLRPDYGGCRSWVELAQEIPTDDAEPVLSDSVFARRMGQLIHRLQSAGTDAALFA